LPAAHAAELAQRPALRNNTAAIAGDLRIGPVVKDIAVEALFPEAVSRNSRAGSPWRN